LEPKGKKEKISGKIIKGIGTGTKYREIARTIGGSGRIADGRKGRGSPSLVGEGGGIRHDGQKRSTMRI